MSFDAVTWAVKAPCQSGNEKAILLIIANYVGVDGTCYPGQATIAQQACCSEKTVERALKAFEERGWIERTPRRRRDGSRTSDLITLLLVPHPEPIENAQPDTVSDRPEPTRHPVQANPTPCPKSPDTMTGPTTFEPPEEPSGDTGRAKPVLDQKACDRFWDAYPEAGRVNYARSSLPIALGRHVARLGSVERLIGAARNYAAAIRKQDTKPKALGNWLADPALVDQYAPAEAPQGPDTLTDPASISARQWRSFVGYYHRKGEWAGPGPRPDRDGCLAPQSVLVEFGFAKREGDAA